jgi:hypothetical protein
MNSTGNKKSGYLVALLLMVGLAAFSNSMRELAEIQRFTLDTSRLIASYIAPAETPQIPQVPQVPQMNPQMNIVAKLGSCDRRQAVPVAVGLDVEAIMEPGVHATVPAPPVKVQRVASRVRVKAVEATDFQLAKLDKLRQSESHAVPFEFNPKQFEFKVLRKQNVIKLNTRDREMILRTLNRSINLRTAS